VSGWSACPGPDSWPPWATGQVTRKPGHTNETLPSRLTLNQYQPNTTLAKEALQVLPDFGIQVCKNSLGDRQAYRQSAVFGQQKAPCKIGVVLRF